MLSPFKKIVTVPEFDPYTGMRKFEDDDSSFVEHVKKNYSTLGLNESDIVVAGSSYRYARAYFMGLNGSMTKNDPPGWLGIEDSDLYIPAPIVRKYYDPLRKIKNVTKDPSVWMDMDDFVVNQDLFYPKDGSTDGISKQEYVTKTLKKWWEIFSWEEKNCFRTMTETYLANWDMRSEYVDLTRIHSPFTDAEKSALQTMNYIFMMDHKDMTKREMTRIIGDTIGRTRKDIDNLKKEMDESNQRFADLMKKHTAALDEENEDEADQIMKVAMEEKKIGDDCYSILEKLKEIF